MIHQQDPVGLVTFDRKIRHSLAPKSKRTHLGDVLSMLSRLKPEGETDIAHSLTQLAAMLRHASLVMIFSDLLSDPEPVLQALHRLRHGGHDVILFHILDEAEARFPFEGMVELEDPETRQRLKYNVFDHCARMKSGATEHLLRCVDDPSEALAEKDCAYEAALEFEDIVRRLRTLLPSATFEGLAMSAKVMKLFVQPHKLLTELLFAFMRYERTVYTDDRLHAIYKIKLILKQLRDWASEGGAELKAIDLAKLCELQGLYPEVRAAFDKRTQHIDVDAVFRLCDGIERKFCADWDYYKWNIIV